MINVGIVGSGFSARLHLDSYLAIPANDVCVYAICSRSGILPKSISDYNIPNIYTNYSDLLKDTSVTLVDICTPPSLHADMIVQAMEHGKDVICEKPLTGFFEPAYKDGKEVSCALMREQTHMELERIRLTVKKTGRRLFYAENYVYAPAVQKCVELLRAKKSKILLIKGEESHSGSHAAHAPYWRVNGGGALIRQGCHPLSAALYLKRIEGQVRSQAIHPIAVTAVTSTLSRMLNHDEHRYISAAPSDVEDYATVIVAFSDGSIAQILANDNTLGGVRNNMEVYTHEGCYQCNIAPNNGMMVYHENSDGLENIYMTEKLGQRAGWQPLFLEENRMRGYHGELEDFLCCLRQGKTPEADFSLAEQTLELIYAAYQSAQEGRTIML